MTGFCSCGGGLVIVCLQMLSKRSGERTCDREQVKGTDTKQESQSLRLAFVVAEAGLEHATSRL